MKKYIAEFMGTFILVFLGTGVAVFSGGNLTATALAFGLAIVASAYSIGDISGCHLNPAVSLAMFMNGKLDKKDFIRYVIAQVLGALLASGVLYVIINETSITKMVLGANGFDSLSALDISALGAAIVEIILTFIFIYTILVVTADSKKANIAPIIIGFTLMFVHLLGIRLTGTSVNPARSLAPAIFQGGKALEQVWLFILAPLAGGALAASVYKNFNK